VEITSMHHTKLHVPRHISGPLSLGVDLHAFFLIHMKSQHQKIAAFCHVNGLVIPIDRIKLGY